MDGKGRGFAETVFGRYGSIALVDRSSRLLPSFAQECFWSLAQFNTVGEACHILLGLRLRGFLDKAALSRALDQLLARHEVLRTSFYTIDRELYQRIETGDVVFDLREEDLRRHDDIEAQLSCYVRQELSDPFDLQCGRLIRGRLIRLADAEHVLLVSMHHIVSDYWSVRVLTRELSALYGAYSQELDDPLAPLVIQYADYAGWQRRWLSGEILAEQCAYWQQTLSGIPSLIELPADRRRPAKQDFTGATISLNLDEALTAGLKALSRQHGVELFMTVLAGWALVLSRLSNQLDVVIGMPSANRDRPGIEGLIGSFINMLALRIDLSASPTVKEVLERVRTVVLNAQDHQDLPFGQVVDLVKPVGCLNQMPLFQVVFAWQNKDDEVPHFPRLEVDKFEHGHPIASFDLTLDLREINGRICCGLTYATAMFDQNTVERWVGYLRNALSQMVADDRQLAAALPILPSQERHKLLVEWNSTEIAYPFELCIHELFEMQVARDPAATAVVYEDSALSYGELNEEANRLAHHLRVLGVRPDSRVAICVERSLEMVVGLLAILKAGGAYVPLDPAYPAERLGFMLKDSAPTLVLTNGPARANLDAALGQAREQETANSSLPDQTLAHGPEKSFDGSGHFDRAIKHPTGPCVLDLKADAKDWAIYPSTNLDPKAVGLTSKHLAYVIYTSGSTGKPKGVMNEHKGLVNRLFWMQDEYAIDFSDAVLQKTSFSFDVSVWEFFWTLIVGARLVMARPGGHKDTGYLTEIIQRENVTISHFVPSMLEVFLVDERVTNVSSLKKIFCSGEALSNRLVKRFQNVFSRTSLYNLYGPTEAAIDVTAWDCRKRIVGSSSPPIGRPISNTRIYLLDLLGNPVPEGVVGEIYIGGAGVARGYLNRPDLTAQRFIESPFVTGDRLYRTGDLGRYLPDADIEFLGRNDFQVKIRGVRIELGEIEARLSSHPLVREAVVLVGEVGGGRKNLIAYYTLSSGIGASGLDVAGSTEPDRSPQGANELRRYLAETLPDYMVPAAYVLLEALPLTPSGKLDRKALLLPKRNAYGRNVGEQIRLLEEPRTKIEKELVTIFEQVLGTAPIGLNVDFFDLGLDSISIVRIVIAIRKNLGQVVEVLTVQLARTVAKLAADLSTLSNHQNPIGRSSISTTFQNAASAIYALRREGKKSPLFLVRPASTNGGALAYAALARHLDPERPIYVLQNRPLLQAEKPYDSVLEMAEEYTRAVRTVQPHGPYLLGGWCLGGKTAYEMAAHFRSAGEPVDMLVLLETSSPNNSQERAEFLEGRTLAQERLRLFARYPKATKIISEEKSMIRRFQLIAYHDCNNHDVSLVANAFPDRFSIEALQRMPPDEMWENVYEALKLELEDASSIYGTDAASVRRAFKYYAIDHQIDALYTPVARYPGRAAFFTVRGNKRAGVGWIPFVSAIPEVYEFDVKVINEDAHNSFMKEENVRPIAAELDRLLDEVSPFCSEPK